MNSSYGIVMGVLACSISITTSVMAHGPQIQIGIEGGQLVTRALILDEPYDAIVTAPQRVFQIGMAQRAVGDENDGWYAQPNDAFPFTGPGIALALGGFETGSILTLGFADGLKIWNGLDFIDPGSEQIDAYRSVTHIGFAITSDMGPFGSFNYAGIANSEDEHKHSFFRLLGDGISPDTLSDDGVYLISLQLSTNQVGIDASDPYFFLLDKNASPGDATAALAYVNTHLVPEPTTLALLGVAGCVLIVRRRRKDGKGNQA